MGAVAAARLGDPIEHSSALAGFLIGALVGLAAGVVGVVVVAATVATGGAALAVVAAVGAGMAATGGTALLGESLGQTHTSTEGAIVAPCALTVYVNGIPAARAVTDFAACSKHAPPGIQNIAQGSQSVFIQGFPAARVGDATVCDGKIESGSQNVFIGAEAGTYLEIHGEVPAWMNKFAAGLVLVGSVVAIGAGAAAAFVSGGLCALIGFGGELAGGIAGGILGGDVGGAIGKAIGGRRGEIIGQAIGSFIGSYFGAGLGGRMAAGHPVDVATGELFTEQTDFRVNGPLPLVWSRIWISSSTIDGALGRGWHHSYDMALRRVPDTGDFVARLRDGRAALFAPPTREEPSVNTVEQHILHTDGERFWLIDYNGLKYEFGPPDDQELLHLVRIADPNGNEIRFERNAAGHLFALVDSAGRLFMVAHDAAGRILSIDGPDPDRADETLRFVTYDYDNAGDLIESRDARGGTLGYEYSNHLLLEERRRGGLGFYFVWDDISLGTKARCVETWGDGDLYRAKLEFNPVERTTVVTTGRGAVSHYRSNELGLVEDEIDPQGAVTRRQYDQAGRLVLLTGPGGEIETTVFDDMGRIKERTNAAGETTRTEYALGDWRGLVHSNASRITGPDGAPHEFAYDERGNLVRHLDPTGVERRFERNGRGLPAEIRDGEGVWRQFRWSAEGNLEWVGVEGGAQMRYGYDRLGRVRKLARGGDAPTRLERDANGNITSIDRPDGGVVRLEYDAEDRITLHRNPLGHETQWRYDGLRYPLERVAADGSRFLYEYDSELNLVGLENPKGEKYRLDYDLAGRLSREIGFDGRVIEYRYNPSGRLVEQLDAGRPTAFVRDALGRLLEKHFADGTSHCFAWTAGRLVLAESAERKVEFGYDKAGRLATEIQDGLALQHAYDGRGRRTETLLPDGRKIGIGYGPDDFFSSVSFAGEVVARVDRDIAGREVYREWGPAGDVRQEQAYDPQGRLTTQQGFRGDNRSIFVRRYRYDTSDLLTQIEDSRRGLKRYHYDPCERLLAVDAENPESFVVDPAGNILGSGPYGRGEAKGDRLLAFNEKRFEYDEHGNRIAEYDEKTAGRVDYRYGPNNELIEVVNGGRRAARFGYDALGRRCWKESSASGRVTGRTDFLWNGDVLLAESQEQEDRLRVVYLFEPGGFRPLAQARGARVYRYHLDHLGTPQEMSDSHGAVVWAADLKGWGSVRVKYVEKVENPFRFQGQYWDEESGLHYNFYRYYDPEVKRYLSPDPIGLDGGSRLYGYVHNPLSWIDPFGLAGCASGGGRGKNKLVPDPDAEGAHSVFRTDPQTGEITHYETFEPQTNPQDPNPWQSTKRYDATGGSHFNKVTGQDVPTPHVHDPATPGGVRPPNPDEVP
jgi:RHS repeat-associated protein